MSRSLAISVAVAAFAVFFIGDPLHLTHDDGGTCRVIDGDTIDCDAGRIRLNGIDAPEMPGHCRPGRNCVAGDPVESRDHLVEVIGAGGDVEVTALKHDHYGRLVANVRIGAVDLSCAQLGAHMAIYRGDWDEQGETARRCPAETY